MTVSYRVTQLVLLGNLALSLWGTWALMKTGGLIEKMSYLRDKGPHILPGSTEPIRQVFTGIGAIDHQLTVLGVFFWSIFDPKHPEYSHHITDFCFQFAVQYGILVIECSRPGNAGRLLSYTAVWGALAQNFGIANTLPAFALLYLATSPTIRAPTRANLIPGRASMISLPFSLILGYFVPVAFMRAPSVSTDSQQVWLAIWQAFPLWVAIFQQVLPAIVSVVSPSPHPSHAAAGKVDAQADVERLRTTYAFLRYLSIFGHLTSWGVAVKALTEPKLFTKAATLALHPWSVWVPEDYSAAFRIKDIGAGAHLFLQYDWIGSSLAVTVFAYGVYTQSRATIADNTTKTSSPSLPGHAWTIAKLIASAAFLGPAGAAINLLEERDTRALAAQEASAKKSK